MAIIAAVVAISALISLSVIDDSGDLFIIYMRFKYAPKSRILLMVS